MVLVGLFGALGTLLRYLVGQLVGQRLASRFPWGTMIINVSGAFVLGALAAVTAPFLSPLWRVGLGTGLVGGYTTFSTLAWESLTLLESGLPGSAALNLVASASLGLAAAALGTGLIHRL